MDSYAPEFSRYWLAPGSGDERVQPDSPRDEAARQQQQALAELAERVTAARTVV
jgi:hypothetical protein